MNAPEYNAREIARGRISAEQLAVFIDGGELAASIEAFQDQKGLKRDGCLGPLTRAAVDEERESKPAPKPATHLSGTVCVPMRGGVWWSGNLFRPWSRKDGGHWGRDGFPGPKTDLGWPDASDEMIISIAAGEVEHVGWQGNGLWIRVNHGFGVVSLSGHLNGVVDPETGKGYRLVEKGQEVVAGTELGPLWGRISLPHIHFQIKLNGKWIEPAKFLEAEGAIVLAAA